jgi:MATE family multidrug resistance protein
LSSVGAEVPFKDGTTSIQRQLRGLLALAIPVVLSELGWMAMSVVDTIMVGKLGPVAIGSVGLANAFYYSPALLGIGVLLGLDTEVSQAFGRRDFDECHRWLAQGIYLACLYVPLCMLLVWSAPWAFQILHVNAQVAPATAVYLRLLNWGTLPLLLYAGFRRYLQGVGRVRPVMFALISANLVNWAGNWALIYGHLGLPAMGLPGSALSTCLARLYMAAVLIYAAWSNERRRGHPLFAHWPGIQWARLKRLLRLGLPSAGQIVLEVGAFGAATVLAGRLTADVLAAHQIVLNWASVTFMVPLGISAAAAVSVGHAVGARRFADARRVGWLAISCGVFFMSLAAIAFVVAPLPILHVYTYNPGVIRAGLPLLALAAAFQVFDGAQAVATGALRGLGHTRVPMIVTLFGYWFFGLPLGYVLCFQLGWGVKGIWAGLTAALIVVACVVMARWSRESRDMAAADVS